MNKQYFFEEIFPAKYNYFIYHALQIVNTYEDAEDIISIAVIYIWSFSDKKWNEINNPIGYMVTTIKSRAKNYLRDNKKFEYLPIDNNLI